MIFNFFSQNGGALSIKRPIRKYANVRKIRKTGIGGNFSLAPLYLPYSSSPSSLSIFFYRGRGIVCGLGHFAYFGRFAYEVKERFLA
jgi:hypothetical protein